MSGPKRGKKSRRTGGLRRREFLRRAGAATAGIAAAPFIPGCDSGDDSGGGAPAASKLRFLHGVASGDPLSDRVILWTRVTPDTAGSAAVEYTVATDTALNNIVASGTVQTDAARDYTVKVDVTGLQPATTYYYRFSGSDTKSAVGRTRTLPTGAVERMRIGVLSCASHAHGLFNATRRVAERSDLDLVLFLGDYLYEYASGEYGEFRASEPAHEIITLGDYRGRHAQYKADEDLQEMHRQHPVIAIWDDHETADNSWKDGAVNHNDGEGDWATRVGVALKAYYEWMPVRQPNAAQPRQNYRSFKFGELAELVLMEERLIARDQQISGLATVSGASAIFAPIDLLMPNNRDMLGPDQEQWLAATLRASTAKWKLLGHGVMLSQFKLTGVPGGLPGTVYINPDQWDGYPAARQRLYDILDGTDGGAPVANVVSLAADVHCSWCNDLPRDASLPIAQLGGYDPLSGAGSLAVEFVATSVTAPGLEIIAPLQPLAPILNPQVRYVDFSQRGYLLLDLTPERVVGEHWYVPTITEASGEQSLGAAYAVADGTAHLVAAEQTEAQAAPPRAP